jgi:hypothetical protein
VQMEHMLRTVRSVANTVLRGGGDAHHLSLALWSFARMGLRGLETDVMLQSISAWARGPVASTDSMGDVANLLWAYTKLRYQGAARRCEQVGSATKPRVTVHACPTLLRDRTHCASLHVN